MSFPILHNYLVICFIELGTLRLRGRQGLLLILEKIAFCIENGGTIALWFPIRRAGHCRTPLCPQQAFAQSIRPLGPAPFLGHDGVFEMDAFMISFLMDSFLFYSGAAADTERTNADFIGNWRLSFKKERGRDLWGADLFFPLASVSQ